jgi:hypothetical protein
MSHPSEVTAEQVAQWMVEELHRVEYLYQQDAVYAIETRFGEKFFYINDAGNPAIDKKVLAAFNKLTGDSVVWERGERVWRMREDYDLPSRQQG